MNNEIQDLIQEIAQLSINNIPETDWKMAKIEAKVISTFASVEAEFLASNKDIKYFDPDGDVQNNDDLTSKFTRLRKRMYDMSPGKGAWYTATLEVLEDGKIKVKYDYDNKPSFSYEPDEEEYFIDLKEFPRDENSIPPWLGEILDKQN